ncbi:hypothetical protein [Mesorhizobium sp. ESP-6-2]|uniref:hypothetical protein n=1 Tax=Mesorhizobium sp. ESP-6-2 TaxID=2876625 RepID=UPI001CCA522C|nr:hypothetical protein [Mesorhizobium sp. ESP-6-2]MBZ9808141.1 hypothetical protein [Mesorhizobium sp. ESP-6-2]
MLNIKDLRLGNGSVTYHRKIDPVPDTKEINENVTIINKGSKGSPAYYEVTFMISSAIENDGLETRNTFHWNCLVAEADHNAAYRSVEDRGARLIAPMLRALADKIEKELPSFAVAPPSDSAS